MTKSHKSSERDFLFLHFLHSALDQTVACADNHRNPIVQLNIWMGKPAESFGSVGSRFLIMFDYALLDGLPVT